MENKNTFGEVVYEVQKDEDVVIVCVNDGKGLKPITLLLPHQIYKEDIEKLKEEYPNHSVICIPAKSSDYTYIYNHDKYNSVELDYEFLITKFDGSKHYYMRRFNEKLTVKELHEEMSRVFSLYENAKAINLNRIYEVV